MGAKQLYSRAEVLKTFIEENKLCENRMNLSRNFEIQQKRGEAKDHPRMPRVHRTSMTCTYTYYCVCCMCAKCD